MFHTVAHAILVLLPVLDRLHSSVMISIVNLVIVVGYQPNLEWPIHCETKSSAGAAKHLAAIGLFSLGFLRGLGPLLLIVLR